MRGERRVVDAFKDGFRVVLFQITHRVKGNCAFPHHLVLMLRLIGCVIRQGALRRHGAQRAQHQAIAGAVGEGDEVVT